MILWMTFINDHNPEAKNNYNMKVDLTGYGPGDDVLVAPFWANPALDKATYEYNTGFKLVLSKEKQPDDDELMADETGEFWDHSRNEPHADLQRWE